MPSKDKEIDKNAVPDRATLKMVEAFRKLRDIYKAAEKAKIPKSRAVKVFNSQAFQDELERQDEAVRMERARQEVRDEKLTNEVIDRELLSVILLDVQKHGSLKLEGIRLGAVMTGRIQAGNTRSLEPGSGGSGTGNFYQAMVQVQEAAPILPQTADEDLSVGAAPVKTEVAAAAAAAATPVAVKTAANPAPKPKAAPTGTIRLG